MPRPEELDDIIAEGESDAEEAPYLAGLRRDVWAILRHLRQGATAAQAVSRVEGWSLQTKGVWSYVTTAHGQTFHWLKPEETVTWESCLARCMARLLGDLTTQIAEVRIRRAIKAGALIATIATAPGCLTQDVSHLKIDKR